LTFDGQEKVWGKLFVPLVESMPAPTQELPKRPDLPWDTATSDKDAAGDFQAEYLGTFLQSQNDSGKAE